jgi:hypothetical protein
MPLNSFEKTANIGAIVEALRRDGAVVVHELAEPGLIDAIRAELRPELDASGLKRKSDFNGSKTLRCSSSVLRIAPSAASILDHDMVVEVANAVLLPHCATYQIGSMSAIEILPGESAQALHRDDSLYPIDNAGMEL